MQAHIDGVRRQTGLSIAFCNFVRKHRANCTVGVAYVCFDCHYALCIQSFLGLRDKNVVQRFDKLVVLRFGMAARDTGGYLRLMEYSGEIQAFRFPMFDTVLHVQQITAANQVVELANPHLCHQFAYFFSHKEEIINDMFRLSGKLFAQRRVLCCNTDRAGIEVALAHHNAAFNHQRCGGKTEFIRTEQCTDQYIASGFQLSVHLQTDATTQFVQHQRLLCFGKTQLPRCSRMFNGRER